MTLTHREGQPISVSLASGAEENDELKLGGVYNVTVSSSAEWKASSRPMEQSGNGESGHTGPMALEDSGQS